MAYLGGCSGQDRAIPIPEDELAACIRWISCIPHEERWPIPFECLTILGQDSLRGDRGTEARTHLAFAECITAAQSCEELTACTPSEEHHEVCESSWDGCVDDVLVNCADEGDRAVSIIDCGAAGMVCSEGNSMSSCGIEPCDPETFEPRCDGDLRIECDSNSDVVQVIDCRSEISYTFEPEEEPVARHGGTCGTDEYGSLDCVGDEEPCDDLTYESHCAGDVLVSCKGGRVARFDCSSISNGFECVDSFMGTDCAPRHFDCSPFSGDACEGGVITFCWDGAERRFNCGDFGFAGCETAESTGSGPPAAYCVD
jgi:hypothetical protein